MIARELRPRATTSVDPGSAGRAPSHPVTARDPSQEEHEPFRPGTVVAHRIEPVVVRVALALEIRAQVEERHGQQLPVDQHLVRACLRGPASSGVNTGLTGSGPTCTVVRNLIDTTAGTDGNSCTLARWGVGSMAPVSTRKTAESRGRDGDGNWMC